MKHNSGVYSFRPVMQADLGMLQGWLEAPHVSEWWGDPEGEIEEISEILAGSPVRPYIVSLEERPFAYIQSYDPHQEYEHPYQDQPAGTLGIDQFIGVADLTGLGHGPAFIRAFCDVLFDKGTRRIVTDPDPENRHAILAYEKAGFRKADIRNTEYGTVQMMHLDAEQLTRGK